jgi:hypothetical protein
VPGTPIGTTPLDVDIPEGISARDDVNVDDDANAGVRTARHVDRRATPRPEEEMCESTALR